MLTIPNRYKTFFFIQMRYFVLCNVCVRSMENSVYTGVQCHDYKRKHGLFDVQLHKEAVYMQNNFITKCDFIL